MAMSSFNIFILNSMVIYCNILSYSNAGVRFLTYSVKWPLLINKWMDELTYAAT